MQNWSKSKRSKPEPTQPTQPVQLSDGGKLPKTNSTGQLPQTQILKQRHGRLKMNGLVQDRAMTFTAFEHHRELVEKEGFDPKSRRIIIQKIDKRIRVDFPHKFAKGGDVEQTFRDQSVGRFSSNEA